MVTKCPAKLGYGVPTGGGDVYPAIAGIVSSIGEGVGMPEEFLVMAVSEAISGIPLKGELVPAIVSASPAVGMYPPGNAPPLAVGPKISMDPVPSSTRKIYRVVATPLVVVGVESTALTIGF